MQAVQNVASEKYVFLAAQKNGAKEKFVKIIIKFERNVAWFNPVLS